MSTPGAAKTGAADQCDCPVCTGEPPDLDAMIDDFIDAADDLIDEEDPMLVELLGAGFLAIGSAGGTDAQHAFDELLVGAFIPAFESRATPQTLALLLAIGSVARGPVAEIASTAADRLIAAGVARPAWADEIRAAITLGECWRLTDRQGAQSMLACSFDREHRSHAFLIMVDHVNCGAAEDILVFETSELPAVLAGLIAENRALGVKKTAVDPAELRWFVEHALDERAVHDEYGDEPVEPDDEDGPDYPTLSLLVRARMRTLPPARRPAASDVDARPTKTDALRTLALLLGQGRQVIDSPAMRGPTIGDRGGRAIERERRTTLPAKRAKAAGPAPIYQIKVSLRAAKPPIWRRLEVRANTTLAQLHDIIQVAFGWDDSHLHAFDTPYGDFGPPGTGLGYRSENTATLEQVAPRPNSKIRYTYDFGDNWEHDVVVEKVLAADSTKQHARCTGGRRAAPPEDCGGMWGYDELVRIMSDPDDPEHIDRLEWLGLDEPFDPSHFDADAITKELSALR